jgi:selenocysteine-specific elongation factor
MDQSLRNLAVLAEGSREEKLALLIAGRALAGMEENEVAATFSADKQDISAALTSLAGRKTIIRVDNLYVHASSLGDLEGRVLQLITEYHKANSLKPGLDKEELKGMLRLRLHPRLLSVTVDGMIKKKLLEAEGSKLRLPGFRPSLGKDTGGIKEKIVEAIRRSGATPPVREELPELFQIPERDARDLLKMLADEGRISRVNDSIYLDRETLEAMRSDLTRYLQEKKEITIAEFRDLVRTSRKYAVPLMEYFDSQKLTQRVGDKRVLRG